MQSPAASYLTFNMSSFRLSSLFSLFPSVSVILRLDCHSFAGKLQFSRFYYHSKRSFFCLWSTFIDLRLSFHCLFTFTSFSFVIQTRLRFCLLLRIVSPPLPLLCSFPPVVVHYLRIRIDFGRVHTSKLSKVRSVRSFSFAESQFQHFRFGLLV
jgi:hypothetical protein